MAIDSAGTLALLIDGDNATPKIITGLLAEIANYGTASVKRIYGDWTKPNLNGWKECLLEHSIQPVQQFAYTTGKNATDGQCECQRCAGEAPAARQIQEVERKERKARR